MFRDAITKLDSKFDLVMITDRFEESIILMKEILCMSDEDVIYLALKVRRETQSTELTTDEGLRVKLILMATLAWSLVHSWSPF